MTKLLDLQSQIEALQKQANDIKAKEFDATVRDIQAKMQAFGITLKDLQTAKPAKPGRGKSKSGAAKAVRVSAKRGTRVTRGSSVEPKYRGPAGETWSGRGLMPKWLRALVDQGQSKESFLIAAATAASASVQAAV
jgi:DNA-binding protein H-NS